MTRKDLDQIERFPFNWQNPFGFSIAIAMQYAMLTYEFAIAAPLLSVPIASYLYGIALNKIIKGSLFAINRSIRAEKTDQFSFLKQIVEFIDVHSSANQLSESIIDCSFVLNIFDFFVYLFFRLISSFSGLFQNFITIHFVWSLVTICGAMLMIQILSVQFIAPLFLFILVL